jgi:hypothetical protein
MGHIISPIGNHKLNTDNIRTLAEDISTRIDINIEYGYVGQKEHFKLLGENKNDETIILGQILKDKNFKTFRLIDKRYQLKELHEKFGDDLFSNPEYWIYCGGKLPTKKIIVEEKKELTYPNFELTLLSDEETEYLSIYNDLYSNNIPYFSRWWTFCRLFTENNFEKFEYLSEFLEFRKILMEYTLSFGGNKIYYLDDQSSVLEGVGQGSEWELSWNEFENFVKNKTSTLMLNIPLFLTDKNYRDEFLEKKELPLSFIDDFVDLK